MHPVFLYKGDTNSALETFICPVFKAPQVASGVPLVIGIRAAYAEIQTHTSRAYDKCGGWSPVKPVPHLVWVPFVDGNTEVHKKKTGLSAQKDW